MATPGERDRGEVWTVDVDFEFQAARRLTAVPPEHPCARLHGHTFRCTLSVSGGLVPGLDWVVDFADVERVAEGLRGVLEHRYLNEIEGLENPTSEVLARWMWDRAIPTLPGLTCIVVGESTRTRCSYRAAPTQ